MSNTDVKALAEELLAAYQTGEKIFPPPTSRDPEFSLSDAYAVEAELQRFRTANGAKVVGRKVGYANKAVWRIMKLDTLVWASMYDDTVRYASDDHATLSLGPMRSAKIEPEIVLGLRDSLPGD